MAAIALLQFRVPSLSIIGDPGVAIVTEGDEVVYVENGGDNTHVNSWRVELLFAPAGSSLYIATPGVPTVIAESPSGNAISCTFTPDADVYGCYRIRLTVWTGTSYTGIANVDIRNVAIPTPTKKFIIPPYQRLPTPLPIIGETGGTKPDEMNFGDQPYGWAGGAYSEPLAQWRLLNATLLKLDEEVAKKFIAETTSDGSAPVVITALPVGHLATSYLISPTLKVITAATAGTVVAQLACSDGTLYSWAPSSIAITGLRFFPAVGFTSSGASAVTVTYTFTGVTGTPSMELRTIIV